MRSLIITLLLSVAAAGPASADFVFIDDEVEPTPPTQEVPKAPAAARPAAREVGSEASARARTEPTATDRSAVAVPPPVPTPQDPVAVVPPPSSQPPLPAPPRVEHVASKAAPAPVADAPEPIQEVALADIELSSNKPVGDAPTEIFSTQVVAAIPTHQARFDVRAGETVRSAFERWTTESGWTLRWQADFDLRIEADNLFGEEELTEVVPLVLGAFRTPPGQKRLTATAFKGNRVLLIEGKVQP